MALGLEDFDMVHNEEILMMLITEVSRATAREVLNELNLTSRLTTLSKAYKSYGRRNVESWIERDMLEVLELEGGKRLRVQDLENLAGVHRIFGYQNSIVTNFSTVYKKFKDTGTTGTKLETFTLEFKEFLEWKLSWYDTEACEEFVTRSGKRNGISLYKNMFLNGRERPEHLKNLTVRAKKRMGFVTSAGKKHGK